MSFFGIGPMELVFILIIMILVLGPKNMVITAQKLGGTLRKIVKSPMWATVMDTSREIREIPTRLIREAGIEEDLKNIKSTTDSIKNVGNISVPYDLTKSNSDKKSALSEISEESNLTKATDGTEVTNDNTELPKLPENPAKSAEKNIENAINPTEEPKTDKLASKGNQPELKQEEDPKEDK
jgi:sec-independent protein translocase protein TatB